MKSAMRLSLSKQRNGRQRLRVLYAAMNNYEKQPENDAAVLEKLLLYRAHFVMIDPVAGYGAYKGKGCGNTALL